jgi:hypothetical protein
MLQVFREVVEGIVEVVEEIRSSTIPPPPPPPTII